MNTMITLHDIIMICYIVVKLADLTYKISLFIARHTN